MEIRSKSEAKKKKSPKKNKKNPIFKSSIVTLLSTQIKSLDSITKIKKKIYKFKSPSLFSLIENPSSVFQQIYLLALSIRKQAIKIIDFDHQNVKKNDLAAESVLGWILSDIKKEYLRKKKNLRIRGTYPESKDLKRYIRSVGIIKYFEIKHEYLSLDEEALIQKFEMGNLSYHENEQLGSLPYRDRVVKGFVDYINNCLESHSRRLTISGRQSLGEYTGEVIDNIIQHSKMNNWKIVGYLDNTKEPYRCDIAIINFGKTFYETFKNLDENNYAFKEQIADVLSAHKAKKLFKKNKWTEENLITLLAIQQGISSKNIEKESTRGVGTYRLIKFFEDMHNEYNGDYSDNAKMAIISGKTHILFDGTYELKQNKDGFFNIAFNNTNDLYKKPNSEFVKNIDFNFPGTIISIQFKITETYTQEITEDGL